MNPVTHLMLRHFAAHRPRWRRRETGRSGFYSHVLYLQTHAAITEPRIYNQTAKVWVRVRVRVQVRVRVSSGPTHFVPGVRNSGVLARR
jgi:hypothetical protein